MKTTRCIFIWLSFIFLFSFLQSNAQFEPAIGVTEDVVRGGVLGRHTGNDIFEDGGNFWEATVFEDGGGSPGFVWQYNNSLPVGVINLAYDATDPDVVFTRDIGNNVHAIVVYYSSGGGGFYVQDFVWSGGMYGSYSPIQFYSAISFGTSVNIDADNYGRFVIVWDDNGIPYALVGDVIWGTINFPSTPVQIGNSGSGTYPDVCFSSYQNDILTYCYLDSYGHLLVEQDDYSWLSGGSTRVADPTLFNPLVADVPTGAFSAPRIACPTPSRMMGYGDNWYTCVVLDSDNSTFWQIKGYSRQDDHMPYVNNAIIYNNSTWMTGFPGGPYPDFTTNVCYDPVVTYDNYKNVFVGFNMDGLSNTFSGATVVGNYPVVVHCQCDAKPVSSQGYWDVPQVLATNDVKDILSLSGKNANDMLFASFYDPLNWEVDSKEVIASWWWWGHLRSQSTQPNANDQINYLDSNPSTKIIANVYDLSGRMHSQFEGEYSDFKEQFTDNSRLRSNQIYLVKILSVDGSINIQEKIYAY